MTEPGHRFERPVTQDERLCRFGLVPGGEGDVNRFEESVAKGLLERFFLFGEVFHNLRDELAAGDALAVTFRLGEKGQRSGQETRKQIGWQVALLRHPSHIGERVRTHRTQQMIHDFVLVFRAKRAHQCQPEIRFLFGRDGDEFRRLARSNTVLVISQQFSKQFKYN